LLNSRNSYYSFFLFFALFFYLQKANAERNPGHCSLKDAVNGRNFLELNPNTYFESVDVNASWVRVVVKAWVDKSNMYEDVQIYRNAKLRDSAGKVLAIASIDFTPTKSISENDSQVYVMIYGYLEKDCIDLQSIPELELSKILLQIQKNAKIDIFQVFLNRFGFKNFYEENDYVSYLITEPDFISQSETPRILMVFFKSELIAIFHTRSIKVKIYDSIEMGKQYKLIFNSKFTEHTKNQMLKIFRSKVEKY
jgi:hypothetical protein